MPSLTPWRCAPPGQSLCHLAALFCNVRHFVVLRCPCPSDDGGEVMAIANRCMGLPAALLGASLAPLVQEKRRPRRRWKYGAAGAAKRGRSKAIGREDGLRPSMAEHP